MLGREASGARYGFIVAPYAQALAPGELGWQAVRQLALEAGEPDPDAAAAECLERLAGTIKRPVGHRRRGQRERRRAEVLEMLGHAAAAQPNYALGATHAAAGQIVSIFWSRSDELARNRNLTVDEMRARVALLNRARAHFGLPPTAGPTHARRRTGSAAHRRAIDAQREFARIYDRLQRIAVDRRIATVETAQTVSLALLRRASCPQASRPHDYRPSTRERAALCPRQPRRRRR